MSPKMWNFTLFFASVILFYTAEAAISEWTEPEATGAAVDATATTTVPESTATGDSTGVTIQATGGGTVTYEILSQAIDGQLTIDSDSGELTLAVGTFDYETSTTYTLVVEATDASDSSKGTATVTLSITDSNDAPEFESAQYGACMTDGDTADTPVRTVTATDQDGDGIAYTITDGNTDSNFKVDPMSGAVSVNDGQTLDASTLAGYKLTVTATDDGTGELTDTTTLWIAVVSSGASAAVAGMLTFFVFLMSFL